jgi:hypothetical protein
MITMRSDWVLTSMRLYNQNLFVGFGMSEATRMVDPTLRILEIYWSKI